MIRNPEIRLPVSLMVTFLIALPGIFAISLLADIRWLLIFSFAVALLLPLTYLLLFRFRLLVFLTVLAVPLSVRLQLSGNTAISFPSELLAGIIALFYLAYSILKPGLSRGKLMRHPLTILIIMDIAWLIVSMLFSEMPLISFKRVIVRITFATVFYFVFAGLFKNFKNLAIVWVIYAAGLVIPVISTLYNHSFYDFSKSVSNLMTAPFYNDHTQYATCIAFVLPVLILLALMPEKFGIARKIRMLLFVLIIILVAGEIFSFSRAAWLSIGIAALIGSMVVFFRFRMVHFVLATSALGCLTYFNIDDLQQYAEKVDSESRSVDVGEHFRSVLNIQTDPSNLERINRWHCAIEMFKDRPVTGFGPGTYQFVYGKYQQTPEMTGISTHHGEKGNAHSEYLTYLSETGIPGFIIFNLLILAGFSTGIRIYRNNRGNEIRWLSLAIMMGFVAYFFHGLFNSFLETDKAAMLVYGSLAALAAMEVHHSEGTINLSGPIRT